MTLPDRITVTTKDGLQGEVDRQAWAQKQAGLPVLVHLDNGREMWVSTDMLETQDDGQLYLPYSANEIQSAIAEQPAGSESISIPVVQEELDVHKRVVEQGKVRIHKSVHEELVTVDEPGYQEEVLVERVPRNSMIDAPINPYYDGDTLVIPVLEEVLVVERKLMLREEVRVYKTRREVYNPQQVRLRSEQISIERESQEPHPE